MSTPVPDPQSLIRLQRDKLAFFFKVIHQTNARCRTEDLLLLSLLLAVSIPLNPGQLRQLCVPTDPKQKAEKLIPSENNPDMMLHPPHKEKKKDK